MNWNETEVGPLYEEKDLNLPVAVVTNIDDTNIEMIPIVEVIEIRVDAGGVERNTDQAADMTAKVVIAVL